MLTKVVFFSNEVASTVILNTVSVLNLCVLTFNILNQVMIAEKASDMIREKDTVKPIKEYFKHLIATKHKKKFVDEEEEQHHGHSHTNVKNMRRRRIMPRTKQRNTRRTRSIKDMEIQQQ